MIVIGAGIPLETDCGDFSDIDKTNVFYNYIMTLKCQNIASGYSDGSFHSAEKISREQLAKWVDLTRHREPSDYEMAIKNLQNSYFTYTKDGLIHSWCGTYVQDYKSIGGHGDSMIMYNPNKEEAFLITGDIWNYYASNGACGEFGYPNNDQWGVTSECGTTGTSQHFKNRQIFSSQYLTTSIKYDSELYKGYEEEGSIDKLGWPSLMFGDELKSYLDLQFPDADGLSQGDPDGDWIDGMEFEYGIMGIDEDPWPNANDTYFANKTIKQCIGSVDYFDHNEQTYVMVVNLNNPDKVCFKTHIGVHSDLSSTSDVNLFNFNSAKFSDLITDKNANLKGHKPIGAFNTAFVGGNKDLDPLREHNYPLALNYVQGKDWTVEDQNWTSISIGRDNNIEFIQMSDNKTGLYNVGGGGPNIYENGKYIDRCINPAINGDYQMTLPACFGIQPARTISAKTSKGFLIVIVSKSYPIAGIGSLLDDIAREKTLGTVLDGILFDGGGSPGMYYADKYQKEGENILSAAILIFEGEACKYR